jgi:hypothetical protein
VFAALAALSSAAIRPRRSRPHADTTAADALVGA